MNSNSQQEISFEVSRSSKLDGCLTIPGDKSISHRSIMLGALANGKTHVHGFLASEDCLATLTAFRQMGVKIEQTPTEIVIHGVGLNGLQAPKVPLDMGNAGTAMRLMAGILAGQAFASKLIGDASLSRRPMARVVEPLRLMGAEISASKDSRPPLSIKGRALQAIEYMMPIASAQVQSCLLLAGMYAEGITTIIQTGKVRDHTQRMLRTFGYPLEEQDFRLSICGGGQLKAANLYVPGDISSAAFFIVAACIVEQADITLCKVGINPTRIGIINILRLMGADIEIFNQCHLGEEPVADLRVKSVSLQGITIPPNQVPLAIDEFPILFIAAACAEGQTVLRGARELRVKESDRIQSMADGLKILGVHCDVFADGICIQGRDEFTGGVINSCADHRVAMAFSIAGLRCHDQIVVKNCANVGTSLPNFIELAKQVGMNICAK